MLAPVVAALLAAGQPQAVKVTAQSPDHVVPLVELFTSEGCSSCPPADRALARLGSDDSDLRRVIPLSYHVTYWDYIGWQDRFADEGFDRRQRRYASQAGERSVYTPQFLLNGRDLRSWRGRLDRGIDELTKRVAPVRIAAELTWDVTHRRLTLEASARLTDAATRPAEELLLYVAIFERDLETAVRAGENRNARLEHDFVVRRLLDAAPWPRSKPSVSHRHAERVPDDWKPHDLGVVIFVQEAEALTVLQSLAVTLVD